MTTTNSDSMKSPISPRLLLSLFTSLSSSTPSLLSSATVTSPRKWHLRRILRSDNPADINGEINGIATFRPLHPSSAEQNQTTHKHHQEMVYKEEGEMPNSVPVMAGLRWTKEYIWRLNNNESEGNDDVGGISIWFVKIKSGTEKKQDDQDEADYLFHEFDFGYQRKEEQKQEQEDTTHETTQAETVAFEPPMPPPLSTLSGLADKYPETKVIQAKGDHLCVKDMYYTAYSFRIVPETGEVLSWASRHVVKGPKKNQDIVNFYSIE